MKHFILLLFVCGLSSTSLLAQSFKYESTDLKYYKQAATPFSTEFKTVTVRIHGEEYVKPYGILASEIIKEHFDFNKYKLVEKEGDLHLDVFIDQPTFIGVTKKTEIKTEDERKVTYHYYQGSIATPLSYELRDGARDMIEEKITHTLGDHYHFTTDRYKSSLALTRYWTESEGVVVSQQMEQAIREGIKQLSIQVRGAYDILTLEAKINFFDLKKADNINAGYLNDAYQTIKSGLAVNKNIGDWGPEKREEIIALYKKGLSLNVSDKKERIGYALSAYNLAKLHMLWGDLDSARKYSTQGRKADRKLYEFDGLEKDIAFLAGDSEKSTDISLKEWTASYQDGADQKLPAIQVVDAATASTNVVEIEEEEVLPIDTLLLINGDVLVGQTFMKIEKGSGDLAIPKIGRIFVTPPSGEKDILLKAKDVEHIVTEGTTIYPIATSAGLKSPIFFYEMLQGSQDEQIYLFATYPHPSLPIDMKEGDPIHIIMMMDGGKGKPKALNVSSGLQFSFGINNGLKKQFEDCAVIVKNAEAKKYKDGGFSLRSLIDDYDSCHPK